MNVLYSKSVNTVNTISMLKGKYQRKRASSIFKELLNSLGLIIYFSW